MIELLPCPMCGCAATFVKHSAGVRGTQGFDQWDAVACKHCRTTVGACDRRFRNREDAATAWNRRVPSASQMREHEARVRAEALEEAARVVDAEEDNAREEHYHPGLVGCLEACAASIRALIEGDGSLRDNHA